VYLICPTQQTETPFESVVPHTGEAKPDLRLDNYSIGPLFY